MLQSRYPAPITPASHRDAGTIARWIAIGSMVTLGFILIRGRISINEHPRDESRTAHSETIQEASSLPLSNCRQVGWTRENVIVLLSFLEKQQDQTTGN